MERQALAELLPQHREALLRYTMTITRDPATAEDMVQETLARALERSDTLAASGALRSWLFRIAHNMAIDHYRTLHEHPSDDLADAVERRWHDDSYTVDRPIVAARSETAEELRDALVRDSRVLPHGRRAARRGGLDDARDRRSAADRRARGQAATTQGAHDAGLGAGQGPRTQSRHRWDTAAVLGCPAPCQRLSRPRAGTAHVRALSSSTWRPAPPVHRCTPRWSRPRAPWLGWVRCRIPTRWSPPMSPSASSGADRRRRTAPQSKSGATPSNTQR